MLQSNIYALVWFFMWFFTSLCLNVLLEHRVLLIQVKPSKARPRPKGKITWKIKKTDEMIYFCKILRIKFFYKKTLCCADEVTGFSYSLCERRKPQVFILIKTLWAQGFDFCLKLQKQRTRSKLGFSGYAQEKPYQKEKL